MDNFIISNR